MGVEDPGPGVTNDVAAGEVRMVEDRKREDPGPGATNDVATGEARIAEDPGPGVTIECGKKDQGATIHPRALPGNVGEGEDSDLGVLVRRGHPSCLVGVCGIQKVVRMSFELGAADWGS